MSKNNKPNGPRLLRSTYEETRDDLLIRDGRYVTIIWPDHSITKHGNYAPPAERARALQPREPPNSENRYTGGPWPGYRDSFTLSMNFRKRTRRPFIG